MKLKWIDSKSKQLQEVVIDLPAILNARRQEAARHDAGASASPERPGVRLASDTPIVTLPIPQAFPASPRSHWDRPM